MVLSDAVTMTKRTEGMWVASSMQTATTVLFCNGAETCDAELGCEAGVDPCPDPLGCDEDTDQCTGCVDDADCDDDLFCNGTETCVDNLCQGGTPEDCDDGVACTVDSCNEDTRRMRQHTGRRRV